MLQYCLPLCAAFTNAVGFPLPEGLSILDTEDIHCEYTKTICYDTYKVVEYRSFRHHNKYHRIVPSYECQELVFDKWITVPWKREQHKPNRK